MATSPNDTSGTVGETVIDVTSMIEHAVRRCGVSAAVVTAEQQASARDNLFLILSDLATKGLSLWCVEEFTFGLTAGRFEYLLPVGTIDVLDRTQLRTATRTAATAVGAGFATLTVVDELTITTALVTPAAVGAYELVLEGSTNGGADWVEAGRKVIQYTGAPIGVDASFVFAANDWRVRDVRDPLRAISAGVFLSAVRDLPMSKLARDDYTSYPDKTKQSNTPLQFWFDKQFYQPRLVLWPVPSQDAALHIYTQRHIQDPGAYTNAVQVPQRWLNAIIGQLAPYVCLELPKDQVPPGRYAELVTLATQLLASAEDSETDGAPIRWAPNISYYTR